MQITIDNLNLHNIRRFFIAYKRKFQIWLFSRKAVSTLFKDNDSIKEFFDAPLYIKEQFIWRLSEMDKSEQGRKCLKDGVCLCGCDVPDLQLSDDACEGGCYPAMMNEIDWNNYKVNNSFWVDLNNKKVIKYV